jgi:hypothetical protein
MGTSGKVPHAFLRNQKLQDLPSFLCAPTVPVRRSAQLFTDNAAKRFLQRLIRAFHMAAQTFIDERLLVASAGVFHLLAEPLQPCRQ